MEEFDTKGRGVFDQPKNKFSRLSHRTEPDYLEFCRHEGETPDGNRTQYIPVFPKTILNKVDSPDVGFSYSANPYQGCEHGCTYCYARPTHEFWGYSPGLDFERKILVKQNAPELLKHALSAKKYVPDLIMLSGNTDCYQPAERHYQITRQLLEICLKFRNPVGIITKNALILRDLDLLKELWSRHLLKVVISITSLSEDTRRKLEPRTASAQKKIAIIETLDTAGIPVHVNIAPVIPWINDHEIPAIIKTISKAGAKSCSCIAVRLKGPNAKLFEGWLQAHYPQRKDKVLNAIRSTHGGSLSNSEFRSRMRGPGLWSEKINATFDIYRRRYMPEYTYPPLNLSDFLPISNGQLNLF